MCHPFWTGMAHILYTFEMCKFRIVPFSTAIDWPTKCTISFNSMNYNLNQFTERMSKAIKSHFLWSHSSGSRREAKLRCADLELASWPIALQRSDNEEDKLMNLSNCSPYPSIARSPGSSHLDLSLSWGTTYPDLGSCSNRHLRVSNTRWLLFLYGYYLIYSPHFFPV
jgi:hypothetical protein